MQRLPSDELLDSDSGTPGEILKSLRDLRHINAWFGGVATGVRMIERVARKTGRSDLSLLEVASGNGYLVHTVRRRLQRRRISLSPTLTDRRPSHLPAAGPAVVADAVQLPFRDDSFDLVASNLFVHHLSPDELLQHVNSALRCCRLAVLISDVVRHPLHLALVYASLPLYRSRLTWNDAPASVRQAYTASEMRQILHRSDAAAIEIRGSFLFRMAITVWKRA